MSKKITIIGGGMGGLSAAYALSKTQELRDSYDVTIYQMGWRLGGKCATGRGIKNRIEEHGIHGFIGSYFNTIKMMRDVYEHWGKPETHRLSTFEKAFIRLGESFFWERRNEKMYKWHPDLSTLPESELTFDDVDNLNDIFVWLQQYARVIQHQVKLATSKLKEADTPKFDVLFKDLNDEIGNLVNALSSHGNQISATRDLFNKAIFPADKGFGVGLGGGGVPAETIPENQQRFEWDKYKTFIDSPTIIPKGTPDPHRRLGLRAEFLKILLRGIRDDDIESKGFISIDHMDFDQWLDKHGASIELMKSPLVVSTINLSFQYPEGDLAKKPIMSASSYVQWVLRLLVYMESPYLLFAAGTGETLITPLYQVLKGRGVKFEFFHALTDVIYDPDSKKVVHVNMLHQAETRDDREYAPLIKAQELDAWPNAPLYDQLKSTPKLTEVDLEAPSEVPFGSPTTLQADKDFDELILAIPPRSIQKSAETLCNNNVNWDLTATQMATTSTQALQIWTTKSVADLSEVRDHFFLSGNFRTGFHGHVDFSKYLEFEDWDPKTVDWDQREVKGLIYFCGVLKNPGIIGNLTRRESANLVAGLNAKSMLTAVGVDIFPGGTLQASFPAAHPDVFDFTNLYVLDKSLEGADRLNEQYFRGNVLPSEQYTQCPPKTQSLRINPLQPGVVNMTGAGDWVDTGLNVGSVEGSVIGGMLAACFVAKQLSPFDIIGMWPTTADAIARIS